MNHSSFSTRSFADVEEGVCRAASRLPGLPIEQIILTRLYRHIAKSLSDIANHILKPFDLNEVSFSALIMTFASADNAISPSQLCDVTGESRTNMTRIMDDLEARGLIRRQRGSADRRRLIVRLTAKGDKLVRTIMPVMWKYQKKIYQDFGVGDMKRLNGILKKQVATIENVAKHGT